VLGGGVGESSSLLANLSAYWKLENLVDSTPNGNNLTNSGGTTFAAGKVNNASNFVAASSQNLNIVDNAYLSFGDIDFAIDGWVKLTDKLGTYAIVGKWAGGGEREYLIRYNPSTVDRFSFYISNDGTAVLTVDADNFGSPTAGVWYYFYAYYDSVNNIAGISINNGTANTKSQTGGAYDGTQPFRIGADGGVVSYMNGMIDEVGVWKRLLTPIELATRYNGGAGNTYPF